MFASLEFYVFAMTFYPFWVFKTKAGKLFCSLMGLHTEFVKAPVRAATLDSSWKGHVSESQCAAPRPSSPEGHLCRAQLGPQ